MSDFSEKLLPPDTDNLITVFAETNFRNIRRKFGIRTADRRRHIYVIGKSGTGKTTLFENLAYQDINNGFGLAVVDPHGEYISHLLDRIPAHRLNDVVYFNPADETYCVGFNPLELPDPSQKNLVASGLMSVFKKIWVDAWSARMEYILNNSLLALLETPNSTLMGIMRLLVDKYYRKKIVDNVTDPVVRSFWVNEYESWSEKFRTEAIAAIQNKVGQFLSSSVIRNVVGQAQSTVDLRDIMDNRKILLMDLSKGRIGDDSSSLLGAMMITKLQLTAMSRINVPEPERSDFFIYVDEFQNFATESFATILSEARKYHLGLVIAHQYIEQIVSEQLRAAIFGNVGTLITFQVGAADAEYLEKEFAPTFSAEDFVNLGKYEIYLRLMIDGLVSQPFSATTLPPMGELTGNRDKVIRVSRERYARPIEVVEDKIYKWAMEDVSEGKPIFESKDGKKSLAEAKPIIAKSKCWVCQMPVDLTFLPDGVRPIYCADCLKKIRADIIPKASRAPAGVGVEVLQADGTWLPLGGAKPAAPKPTLNPNPLPPAPNTEPEPKKIEPIKQPEPVVVTTPQSKTETIANLPTTNYQLPTTSAKPKKVKPWQKLPTNDDLMTPEKMKTMMIKKEPNQAEKSAFEKMYEDESAGDDDFKLVGTATEEDLNSDDFKPLTPGQVIRF